MFGTHNHRVILLHTPGDGAGTLTGQQRILGEVFEVASAQRMALQIHRRSQPYIHVEILAFLTDCIAKSVAQL